MSSYFLLILFFWIIVCLFDYGEFSYLIQLKEYRLDRFKDFISTKQGKKFLKGYLFLKRPLLVFILFHFSFDIIELKYIIFLLLFFELSRYFLKIFRKKIVKPKFTLKISLILFFSLFFEIFLLVFLKSWSVFFILLILRFFTLSLFVFIFSVLTKTAKIILLKLASNKIKKYFNLKIIGITGSYGKTTVKNFLFSILESKYKVIKTPKNINTEIGIARFILKNNFSNFDIFIIEMGAYGTGEIKLICDAFNPEIGILTAINEQHLSLFKNIKNTQKAKYELLKSLPQKGLAVVNSDNFYCREKLDELICKVKTFGIKKKYNPDCLIKNIITEKEGVIFCFEMKGLEYKIKTNIKGEHNAINIASCFLVADYLKIKASDIIEKCKELSIPAETLKEYQYGKSIVIDDTYNSNPEGFMAALKLFINYSSEWKKIVITRGMLELGEKSKELHKKIGVEIGKYSNELIITSPDNKDSLIDGAGDRIKIIVEYDFKKIMDYVKKMKNEKCIILLENRINDDILKEIKN